MVRLIRHPGFLIRYILFGAALLGWLAAFVPGSAGQDASQRPAHAGEVVAALERARWVELRDGLLSMRVNTALGTRLTAISIDLETHRFGIILPEEAKGERASTALRRESADMVVNGGFFAIGTDETLRPVGRLIINGEPQSTAWPSSGGYLALDDNGTPFITLSQDGMPKGADNAIQTKPVLIEPGGRWAMNTNGTELAWRTLFCMLQDNRALIVIVHGNGLTLFEAGWVLRGREWGGFFGCDSAIALDGGGSTQLAVRGHDDLSVTGLTRVHNMLSVFARQTTGDE